MNMDEGELSDQFLIDAIAGKGMWALERLYDRYGKRFYALAYRMTADLREDERPISAGQQN